MQTVTKGLADRQWVVTYQMEPRVIDFNKDATDTWCVRTMEFYRGPREECIRIWQAFGGGEDDKVRTKQWQPIIGPVAEWEDFIGDDG